MGWGYLGVCADAYLACSRIQIFSCTYKQKMKGLKPVYVADNHGFGFRFGFGLTNCTAMGPFYPNDKSSLTLCFIKAIFIKPRQDYLWTPATFYGQMPVFLRASYP